MSDIDKVLLRARATIKQILYPFEYADYFRACKHSGGVTNGVSFKDTSLDAKFTYPISISPDARDLFSSYCNFDPRITDAIVNFNDESLNPLSMTEVSSSRATTVPKTNEIDRMIAIEPTANMFLQQGLMTLMYERLKEFGLDVATLPDLHKKLAKHGSITGLLATIDFASASDCVSINLLRYLIPETWLSLISTVRCSSMEIDGIKTELNMSSTMGNATTFPLELLVFFALASACDYTRTTNTTSLHIDPHYFGTLCNSRTVSVFGDDCILPTASAPLFIKVCEALGFIVNSEKSFYKTSERFRESCGGDYYHGFDVRAFYLKGPHDNRMSSLEPWLYTILNGVLTKYKSYFGPLTYVYDKRLFEYLFSLFRRYKIRIKLIPDDFPSDAGLYAEDGARLVKQYDCKLSRIIVDNHGTQTFSYCTFQYNTKRPIDGALHYYTLLKRSRFNVDRDVDSDESHYCYLKSCARLRRKDFSLQSKVPKSKNPEFIKTRRKGGYVVALSHTSLRRIWTGVG